MMHDVETHMMHELMHEPIQFYPNFEIWPRKLEIRKLENDPNSILSQFCKMPNFETLIF